MEEEEMLNFFEYKVKNLKLNSIIEQNNFSLLRKFYNGEIICDDNGYNIYSINCNFIEESIQEINTELQKINTSEAILKQLRTKLQELRDFYIEYRTYESISKKHRLSNAERKMKTEVTIKTFYSIIELRASLGLSIEGLEKDSIYSYFRALVCDINNEKYERLSFQKHIINCEVSSYK